ncbi:MAG: hypothetical protein M3Y56_02525 [Armatimonadota bacterium]|nr:hypothetical protein [Armatimonadota bacterium]
MAGAKGKSGGSRQGAGRKSKAEQFKTPITNAEKRIADRLPQVLDNLFHLADGGYERVEEKWELREVFVDDVDQDGEKIRVGRHELTLVERKVTYADKDRAANIYLADRILGKPTERQEVETKTLSAQVVVNTTFDELRKLPAEELAMRYREALRPPGADRG